MKYLSVVSLWLGMIVAIASLGQTQPSPAVTPKTASISVSIFAPHTDVTTASAIPLEIKVTNISAQDINLVLPRGSAPGLYYLVDVRASDGLAARKTDAYRNSRGEGGVPVIGSGGVLKVLPPGQSFREEVILNELYQLQDPGNYTVRVIWTDPVTQEAVSSNPATLALKLTSPLAKMPGTANPPFSIVLRSSEHVFPAGSQVKVEVDLVNRSDHEIAVPELVPGKPEVDYQVRVFDERGNSPKATDYLETVEQTRAAASTSSLTFVSVPPLKLLKGDIILSDLFDLSRPGRYTVEVSRRDETGTLFRVKSNLITIVMKQ